MKKLKTWEIVFEEIKKNQPIQSREIKENLGLREGQVAGALSALRKKDLVIQSENKAYLVKQQELTDFMLRDIQRLLKNYPKPKNQTKEKYQLMYGMLEELEKIGSSNNS